MNKEEIIKEYKNYCSDLDIDYKKNNSKSRFIFDYLKHLHNLGKLSYYKDFEQTRYNIESILKGVN